MGAHARAAGRALALGLMHGPAELLPISSSGHIELIPWLLRWDEHADADPDVRKAFEVALHAGTAAALQPPATGPIPVACVISSGAVLIATTAVSTTDTLGLKKSTDHSIDVAGLLHMRRSACARSP